MGFLEVMNSKPLYIMVMIGLGYVFLMCVFMMQRAWKHCLSLGMTKSQLMDIVKSSTIYTIIPSLSVVIGLFSLSTVLGVPWSWFRLSVIGSVSYELVAADMAAIGAGYDSLAALVAANDVSVVGSVMLSMSIGIIGGVVGCLFIGKKIHLSTMEYSASNGEWGALMMACFTMAMHSVFLPARSIFMGSVATATLLTSALCTYLHNWAVKKYGIRWLSNFTMADSLIVGMASAILWTNLLG
ncbi:DUF5058 family protein [Merdimmobilis hominis]|uniref:DUF5058 domain-containing protein n=1 Tax=uncultured Anaerotruncus sp. TaxID=905011 RepID=A0A6N2SYM9_9FIRM|nr:DUF5058 family protein [Merdimmobilis hominis]PWL62739.1 MAG: DUF5058 domain-containing protein [Oscillospiraceae bacterium]